MMDHFKEDIVSPRAKALSNVLYVLCWVFIVLFGGYALMMLQVVMLQFSVTALVTVLMDSPSGMPDKMPIKIAEIMSDGNACIRVKIISPIITTTPINIAITGFIQLLPFLLDDRTETLNIDRAEILDRFILRHFSV